MPAGSNVRVARVTQRTVHQQYDTSVTIVYIATTRNYLRLYRLRGRVRRRVASISIGVWVFRDGEWGREGREGRRGGKDGWKFAGLEWESATRSSSDKACGFVFPKRERRSAKKVERLWRVSPPPLSSQSSLWIKNREPNKR